MLIADIAMTKTNVAANFTLIVIRILKIALS